MFQRHILKQRAKNVLSKDYWNIFIAILLINIVTSAAGGIIVLATGGFASSDQTFGNIALYAGLQLTSTALSVALSALLVMPLQVGLYKYILELSGGTKSNVDRLFYAFRTNYMGIATVCFLKQLIIFAFTLIPVFIIIFGLVLAAMSENNWFLLVIIAGYAAIIPAALKVYDYYLVELILTDKPNLSWREALGESKRLMRGNRFKTFLLNLSFIGWYLLGFLACGIGVLFVTPYVFATDCQLYLELSEKNTIEL